MGTSIFSHVLYSNYYIYLCLLGFFLILELRKLRERGEVKQKEITYILNRVCKPLTINSVALFVVEYAWLISIVNNSVQQQQHMHIYARARFDISSAERPIRRERRHRTQETPVTGRGLSSSWRIRFSAREQEIERESRV